MGDEECTDSGSLRPDRALVSQSVSVFQGSFPQLAVGCDCSAEPKKQGVSLDELGAVENIRTFLLLHMAAI